MPITENLFKIKRTNTSPHELVSQCGHDPRLQLAAVCGFVFASQLKSLSLHSTKRFLTPEPQVTEHWKDNKTNKHAYCSKCRLTVMQESLLTLSQFPVIHLGQGLMLHSSVVAGFLSSLHPWLICPFRNLHSTIRCLTPCPQEAEH